MNIGGGGGGDQHQTKTKTPQKKKKQPTLKTLLPVKTCYLHVNHSHLRGVHVLAKGWGGVARGEGLFSFAGTVVLRCPKETS